MAKAILSTMVAIAIFGLPLVTWRFAYAFTDWAVLPLLALCALIFAANRALILEPWQAKLRVALRDESWLARVLTGKIGATFVSALFAIATVYVLAWQALVVSETDSFLLLTLAATSILMFFFYSGFTERHLHGPFARPLAVTFATITTLPFFFVLAYRTFAYAAQPGDMLDASLAEAIELGLAQLPQRSGWVTQAMALPYAYDAAKLWVVVQLSAYPMASWLFCLDAALISFVLARACIVVASFVTVHVRLPFQRPVTGLSRWFWGTIAVMACLNLGLIAASMPREGTLPKPVVETEPTIIITVLTVANAIALREVKAQIPAALDQAYGPVYAAIPAYADFHYSLAGEYFELSEAALGNLATSVQDRLFAGMQNRMMRVAGKLDENFDATFSKHIDATFDGSGGESTSDAPLGPLTNWAVNNAKARVAITAPLATTATVVGGKSITLAATVIASKLGGKITTKVAAKAGAKWATTLTGAGSGALICGWAGPAAGICAAGGAVVAWFATDLVVIKLDEVFNRQEFEAELRALINEDRRARQTLLENAVTERAVAVQTEAGKVVADFTIKSLTKEDLTAVCNQATALVQAYELYRTGQSHGDPTEVNNLRKRAQDLKSLAARPLTAEIVANLNNPPKRRVSQIQISGNLPADYAADRSVTPHLHLHGQPIEFGKQVATKDQGFAFSTALDLPLPTSGNVDLSIAVEQHNLLWNILFGGSVTFDPDLFISQEGGRSSIKLTVPLGIGDNSQSVPYGDGRTISENDLSVILQVLQESPPELTAKIDCQLPTDR